MAEKLRMAAQTSDGFRLLVIIAVQQLEAEFGKKVSIDDPGYAIKTAHRDGRIASLTAFVELVERYLLPGHSPDDD